MNPAILRKLARYLTGEQLEAYIHYTDSFMTYFRSKTAESLTAYKEAHKRFVETTGGREACEIIPLNIWQ